MSLLQQKVGILGVVCVLAALPNFAQATLVNGTFVGIEPWTMIGWAGPNSDISHTADGSGSAYVYMRQSEGEALQQTVAVAPNSDYTLSWFSTVDTCTSSIGVIRAYGVSEGVDVELNSQAFYPGGSWTSHSFDFNTAGYDQVKISYESGTNALHQYYRIDDVTLTPEPATLSLLGLGVLGLLRKRK